MWRHARPHPRGYVELGGPGLRQGVVSAQDARQGAAALVCAALRGGRAQLELLRDPGPQHRARLGRGHAPGLRVRRQGAPRALAPRGAARVAATRHARRSGLHGAPRARSPGPGARDRAGAAPRRGDRPAGGGRQARRLPPSAHPRLRAGEAQARGARSPRGDFHAAAAGDRAAPPWLGAREAPERHAPVVLRARGGLRVRGRAARRPRADHAVRHRCRDTGRPRLHPAARSQHGRVSERQVRGGAIRLALHGRRARGGGATRAGDGRAGRRGARGVQQQPRRRRARPPRSASARFWARRRPRRSS